MKKNPIKWKRSVGAPHGQGIDDNDDEDDTVEEDDNDEEDDDDDSWGRSTE